MRDISEWEQLCYGMGVDFVKMPDNIRICADLIGDLMEQVELLKSANNDLQIKNFKLKNQNSLLLKRIDEIVELPKKEKVTFNPEDFVEKIMLAESKILSSNICISIRCLPKECYARILQLLNMRKEVKQALISQDYLIIACNS